VTAEEISQFRHESAHALTRLNDSSASVFKISSWQRYDYDLERGTLTFSQNGVPRVVASILVAGTTSQSGGTWLWSWANGYLPENVSEPLKKVRNFGIAENIPNLTEPYVPDDGEVGWELTAIATRILEAKGAYRCPGDNGFMYLIMMDIAFADLTPPVKSRNQITCSTHGTAYETYVCKHLIAHPKQRWFCEEIDRENPWPDAWCAACDVFFQEQGEGNEANEKQVNVKLLCHHCYEMLRAQALPIVQ